MYVVSEDIELLMGEWAAENGFLLSKEMSAFTRELENFLRRIFSEVEFVKAQELRNGMLNLVQNTAMMPVSLDRVYFRTQFHLDATRGIDLCGNESGPIARHGYKPLSEQLDDLAQALKQEKNVVLVDDVVFSGGLLLELIDQLKDRGVNVTKVVAGVAIGKGVLALKKRGVEVDAVRFYESVIDEVCERDFFPGVPFSGRTLAGDGNMCEPYVLPFGNPQLWASIPAEQEVNFSKFCLNLTADMFDDIGRMSGRQIFLRDLGRRPRGIDSNDEKSFADILRKLAAK